MIRESDTFNWIELSEFLKAHKHSGAEIILKYLSESKDATVAYSASLAAAKHDDGETPIMVTTYEILP